MTVRLHRLVTTSIAPWLLPSPPLAAQTVATPLEAHRLHGDPTAYMASLDDPKRDAWGRPPR